MKKTDLYQAVTNRIMTALKQGVIPWQRTFKTSFSPIPVNYKTGNTYRGINVFLLNIAGWQLGYPHNIWLTYNQARKLGGYVKKGVQAETILFWKPSEITTEDENGEEKSQTIYIVRSYSVFNIEQCEGLDLVEHPIPSPELGSANQIFANYPHKRPELITGNRAAYYPQQDRIRMPQLENFTSPTSYYTTLFHELVHSTGHDTRLSRKGIAKAKRTDKIRYAQEELVAEMGASFLTAFAGIITPALITNTTAYIQNWLKALSDDKKMVIKAASRAQKAVDFILGN